MNAICIRCGTVKKLPWQQCRKCQLKPTGEDLVKSVYCSIGRFESPDVQTEYGVKLEQVSETIRRGGSIDFDESELDRLRQQSKMIDAIPASRVWEAVFRFFLPAVVFLGLLFGLVALFKR